MNNKKVLIIDDDHDIVEAMEAMLSIEEYMTISAYSGNEGVKRATQENPHLVLLDFMLPDISGKEVAEKLRTSKSKSELPIILVSAANNAKEIAKEIPVNDFLEKPFDMESLLAIVRTHLS